MANDEDDPPDYGRGKTATAVWTSWTSPGRTSALTGADLSSAILIETNLTRSRDHQTQSAPDHSRKQ
jgi:hypothetical protein